MAERAHPYSRFNSIVENSTLKSCGIKPSVAKHGILYRTTYTVHRRSGHTIAVDIFHKTDGLKIEYLQLEPEIIPENREYCDVTVYNYKNYKFIINKIQKFKNDLEVYPQDKLYKNIKKFDKYKDVVKIYKKYLLNRCSLKLINLNFAFNNIIKQALCKEQCAYVDLCCAPGGFTYTILQLFHDKHINVHLTSMCHTGTFLPIEIDVLNESCGRNVNIVTKLEGDITKNDFRVAFCKEVGEEVDFVLADGGMDFSTVENYQEYYSRKLILSQLVTGLALLKNGGFMICKMFDLFSKYSVTLLMLMSTMFEDIIVCKPSSSKSGNAERYILFRNFKPNDVVIDYMKKIINEQEKNNSEMLNAFVSINDNNFHVKKFLRFIETMNKNIASKQIIALQKYLGKITMINEKEEKNIAFHSYRSWMQAIQFTK